jgi:hypothetical protein
LHIFRLRFHREVTKEAVGGAYFGDQSAKAARLPSGGGGPCALTSKSHTRAS